jgi:hypothetical protein
MVNNYFQAVSITGFRQKTKYLEPFVAAKVPRALFLLIATRGIVHPTTIGLETIRKALMAPVPDRQ